MELGDLDGPAPTVAGESLDDLVKVMSNMELGEKTGGLTDLHLLLNGEEAAILHRALMRLEAELLLDDADQLEPRSFSEMRTPAERQHDAFMLLVRRIIEAAGEPG